MERSSSINIPINVQQVVFSPDASQSPQILDDPLHKAVTDDQLGGLSPEETVSLLKKLSADNKLLKNTVQRCHASMQDACSKLASLKKKEKYKENTLCEKAKRAVETLKQNLREKDEVIIELREQCSSDIGQLQKLLAESQQTAVTCKQQVVQLQGQLHTELAMNKTCVENLKSANSHIAALQEQLHSKQLMCNQLDSKIAEDSILIENLCCQVRDLTVANKSEKEKNVACNRQLVQLRVENEQTASEYLKLLNSPTVRQLTSKMSQKDSDTETMRNDYEQRIENLMAQIVSAQNSVTLRDAEIVNLESRLKDIGNLQEVIKVLQEEKETLVYQATLHRADFDEERKSREDLNDQLLEQREKVERLEAKLTALGHFGNDADLTLASVSQRRGAAHEIEEAIAAETGLVSAAFGGTSNAPDNRQLTHTNEQEFVGDATSTVFYAMTNFTTQVMNHTLTLPDELEKQYLAQIEVLQCPTCLRDFPDSDSLLLHCNDSECIK